MLATLALLAATHAVDVPATLAPVLPAVEARTELTVLLPASMPSERRTLYPSADAGRRRYSLELSDIPDCGSATACFEADFRASAKGRPFGRRAVQLAKGLSGRFQPLSCGASCSPPSISWRERGALYTIQANVGTRRTERRILVRMANSAIRAGAR
jgi:hypothetical protein